MKQHYMREYKHIYLMGNGGSYANAVHIANDFLMVGLRAYTLDPASLTRTANDRGYYHVFSDWIETVGEPGDLLIGLSGSGRSPNITMAFEVAKRKGMATMGVFGAYNEHKEGIADTLVLGGDDMQEAEQHQLVWAHEIMKSLRK